MQAKKDVMPDKSYLPERLRWALPRIINLVLLWDIHSLLGSPDLSRFFVSVEQNELKLRRLLDKPLVERREGERRRKSRSIVILFFCFEMRLAPLKIIYSIDPCFR